MSFFAIVRFVTIILLCREPFVVKYKWLFLFGYIKNFSITFVSCVLRMHKKVL